MCSLYLKWSKNKWKSQSYLTFCVYTYISYGAEYSSTTVKLLTEDTTNIQTWRRTIAEENKTLISPLSNILTAPLVICLWSQCQYLYWSHFPRWLTAIYTEKFIQKVINACSSGILASDFNVHFLNTPQTVYKFKFHCLILSKREFPGHNTIKILSTKQTRWYSTQWLKWQMLRGSHTPYNYLHIVIPHSVDIHLIYIKHWYVQLHAAEFTLFTKDTPTCT